MPEWPPSVTACLAAPPRGAQFRCRSRRTATLLAALAAPAAAAALAGVGPALHGPADLAVRIGAPALGLLALAGLGVLVWQLARVCTRDAPPPPFARAALLPALLPAALLPGAGIATLLVPAALALHAGRSDRANHIVALLVQCAALPLLAARADSLSATLFGCATILGAAWFALALAAAHAANDNPRLEQIETNWRLPEGLTYDKAGRDSQSGKWGVS